MGRGPVAPGYPQPLSAVVVVFAVAFVLCILMSHGNDTKSAAGEAKAISVTTQREPEQPCRVWDHSPQEIHHQIIVVGATVGRC